MNGRLLWLSSALCLALYDCGSTSRFAPTAPDPTKGTVTGTVLCADTGKPARFASVELVRSSGGTGSDKSSESSTAITGLDGKFTIQGVAPGDYYAFATLDGYLNPIYGIDFARIDTNATDEKLNAEMIDQWKDHMVEVAVNAQQTADLPITIERGAEITGAITYDDGSAAVGLRFALYRKNSKGEWARVGLAMQDTFSMEEKSGARGRYDIANLSAGEYVVCSLLPVDNEANSPQVCLGNTFRKRDAKPLSVGPGDTVNGADITVPLGAIHSISGTVVQGVSNQPVSRAKIHLLYADDREEAMVMAMFTDGSFLLPFVPQGSYIVQVTDAAWTEPAQQAEAGKAAAPKTHAFAVRELQVTVDQDVKELKIGLMEVPAEQKPGAVNGGPASAASPQ